LRERFAAAMAEHPLLREIIATQLANQLVNSSGATFAAGVAAETTASTAEIVRAHTAARQVFDTDAVWADIEALDDVVSSDVQTSLLIVVRQLLDRGARWFLANRRPPMDVPETVTQLEPGVRAVLAGLGETLRGEQAERFAAEQQRLTDAGVAPELARRAVALGEGLNALSVVEIGRRAGLPVDEVARVHFTLADVLGISQLSALVAALPRDTRWHTLARAAARDDLVAAHAELTADVLASTPAGGADERIEAWRAANAAALTRAGAVVDDILGGESADLATLSVALREVRALVRAAALPGR
jgi:glutamate dehydrogenase